MTSPHMEKRFKHAWVDPDAVPGKPSVPLVVILDRVGE